MKRPAQQARDVAGEVAELREATRQAHEVLGDLRRERRAVEQFAATVRADVEAAVRARIEAEVERQVGELAEVTKRAMRESVAKVEREFDRLARIFTGRENPDRPDLEEVIRARVARVASEVDR